MLDLQFASEAFQALLEDLYYLDYILCECVNSIMMQVRSSHVDSKLGLQ